MTVEDPDPPRARRRRNGLLAERFAGIPWALVAVGAVGVALAYALLPSAEGAEGARWIILRWGHSVAWLFFAAAAAARARVAGAPMEWTVPLAATGGLVYLAYMVTAPADG